MDYELISDGDIEAIKSKLTHLVPEWARLIAEKIDADKHWKVYAGKKCTDVVVYNIGHNKIKSQLHRRLFVKYAGELLEPCIKEQTEAIGVRNELVQQPNANN